MPITAGPKDVLRWVIALLLGAFALGAAVVAFVVGAGKLGLRLMPTLEMDVLVLTTAWSSVVLSAITAIGFATTVVLLLRKRRSALWAWLVGFAAAAIQQGLESTQTAAAGATSDPSGFGILALLAVAGWGIYTVSFRRPPTLPPGISKR